MVAAVAIAHSLYPGASMRWIVFFVLLAGACTSDSEKPGPAPSGSGTAYSGHRSLPGRRGRAGRAPSAADSAAARNARLDSVDR